MITVIELEQPTTVVEQQVLLATVGSPGPQGAPGREGPQGPQGPPGGVDPEVILDGGNF
ncbi:MAG TPA: hypothetical protein VNL74_03960 [Methylococcus sp.]|nr:hypothetical protein [Methylococcus sp.]